MLSSKQQHHHHGGARARGLAKSSSVGGELCTRKQDGSLSDTGVSVASGGRRPGSTIGAKMVAMVGLRSRSTSQLPQTGITAFVIVSICSD